MFQRLSCEAETNEMNHEKAPPTGTLWKDRSGSASSSDSSLASTSSRIICVKGLRCFRHFLPWQKNSPVDCCKTQTRKAHYWWNPLHMKILSLNMETRKSIRHGTAIFEFQAGRLHLLHHDRQSNQSSQPVWNSKQWSCQEQQVKTHVLEAMLLHFVRTLPCQLPTPCTVGMAGMSTHPWLEHFPELIFQMLRCLSINSLAMKHGNSGI